MSADSLRRYSKDASIIVAGAVLGSAASALLRRSLRTITNDTPCTAIMICGTSKGLRTAISAAAAAVVAWGAPVDLGAVAWRAGLGGALQFAVDESARLLRRSFRPWGTSSSASGDRRREIQRITYIPLKRGVRPQDICKKMEEVSAPLRSFPGLLDLQVLAVSNARLLTHARWLPKAAPEGPYVSGASTHAAKRALILFVLKDFLSGAPDTIVQGHFAFEVKGAARPSETSRVACRVTVFTLKDRAALDTMLKVCRECYTGLEGLEGLIEIQAFASRDDCKLVMKALYNKKTNLDAAALAFGALILPPSTHLHAESPEVSITELVWSLEGGDRIEGTLKKSPSFSNSFAWVSG